MIWVRLTLPILIEIIVYFKFEAIEYIIFKIIFQKKLFYDRKFPGLH